jgi:hypothetical protein
MRSLGGLVLIIGFLFGQDFQSKKPNLSSYYKSPPKAMVLSLLIPGAGQYYCEEYLKGTMLLAAEGTLGYYLYKAHEDYKKTQDNEKLKRRDNFLWWLITVKAISLADAYISAQMYKFNEQMRLTLSTILLEKVKLGIYKTF